MDDAAVKVLVERELARISDPKLADLVRELRVEPYAVERDWDYGSPGQRFVCWTVLEHNPSGTGVVYCDDGFGPERPWGLVFLSGPHMGIGMDYGWYASLGDAVQDSMAWHGNAS